MLTTLFMDFILISKLTTLITTITIMMTLQYIAATHADYTLQYYSTYCQLFAWAIDCLLSCLIAL